MPMQPCLHGGEFSAAHQHRIAGLEFSGAVFTNITHDHLDYYGTFDNYIAAKKMLMLYLHLPLQWQMQMTKGHQRCRCRTQRQTPAVSVKGDGDFTCRIIANEITGLQLKPDGEEFLFQTDWRISMPESAGGL